MVITYLLILTGVVGYACWRGYQLEVWVGELSKSVGQLANSVTRVEVEQERAKGYAHDTRDLAYGTSDRVTAIGPLLEDLRSAVCKPAKKPRGKK